MSKMYSVSYDIGYNYTTKPKDQSFPNIMVLIITLAWVKDLKFLIFFNVSEKYSGCLLPTEGRISVKFT